MSTPLTLASGAAELPLIAVGGVFLFLIVSTIVGGVTRIHRTRQREESRREIAAYIAEGSMTPDDAERILEAGMKSWERPKRRPSHPGASA